MNKKIIAAIFFLIASICLVSADHQINVTFNGEWNNGTTLYSDDIYVKNHSIVGKDVYPFRMPQNRTKVCQTTYTTKVKKVCEILYFDGKRMRQCHTETYQIPKTKCKIVTTPTVYACLNPNGEYTNQFRLENFKVSLDGGTTWQDIPYAPNFFNGYYQLIVVGKFVRFKVNIPEICYPSYKINDSIVIKPNI